MPSLHDTVQAIRDLVDPASTVTCFENSLLLAELHLKPDHKVSVCHALNRLLKPLSDKIQIILAVLNDDDDRYARLIGKGLGANEVNTDKLF